MAEAPLASADLESLSVAQVKVLQAAWRRRRNVQRRCKYQEMIDSLLMAYELSLSISGVPMAVHSPSSFRGTRLYEHFMRACAAAPSGTPIMLGFHGTPSGNIPAILENGLDPLLRELQAHGPGEYFATSPYKALKYAGQGGAKDVIAFALLMDP